MKKIFTFLILFISFSLSSIYAQRATTENIQRNLVLVEIGTGGWCYYCPGAAMGADDLVANGHPVAIVENHNGDPYANTYSNARNSYYGVPGYPTAYFDGVYQVVGGSNTSSMYNSYVPKVNARMAVDTPFDIDFSYTDNGDDNFTVSVNIDKVGEYENDVVLHVFITESNIAYNWQGQDHVNFVNRLMVPNQNGTALDFSAGNNIVEELSFDLDPSWVRDECEIVVAIQHVSSKEVFNAAKVSMLQAAHSYDAGITNVFFPMEQACDGEIAPRIELTNFGGVYLESADITYSVNGGDEMMYTWEGSLAFLEAEAVSLPSIPYAIDANNTIEFTVSNPNGEEDENMDNDYADSEFTEAQETSMNIEMQLYTGSSGNEISWAFYNSNGEIAAEGSGYGDNEVVEMLLPIEESGCFDFMLYDASGNGFSGNGYLKLYDNGLVFEYITDDLEDILSIPFHAMNDLSAPGDFSATTNDYEVTFEWTAPAKASLEGYHIYEASDMSTPINDALITETSYVYTLASNGAYEYYLVAVYDEGMSDPVGPVFVDLNVGLTDLSNAAFNIYPNPIKDQAQLQLNLEEDSQVSWSIVSLTGKVVFEAEEANMKAGKHLISVQSYDLEEGIYFIQMNIDDKTSTAKIVVLK